MAKPYKSTPVFTQDNLPPALQEEHSIKAGSWGILELLSGELIYITEESGRRHMTAGDEQIIEPQLLHHVELCGAMQMQVHFFREKPA